MATDRNFREVTARTSSYLKKLRADMPETMRGFSALAQAAGKPGVLDAKTKELIALGIGVAARCDGCIGFHTQALARLGATRAEVHEVLGIAVYMGGGPALMYAANAVAAFDECAPAQAPAATA